MTEPRRGCQGVQDVLLAGDAADEVLGASVQLLGADDAVEPFAEQVGVAL